MSEINERVALAVADQLTQAALMMEQSHVGARIRLAAVGYDEKKGTTTTAFTIWELAIERLRDLAEEELRSEGLYSENVFLAANKKEEEGHE